MGYKSGFYDGHTMKSKSCFKNQSRNNILECFGSLSCWKIAVETSRPWLMMVAYNFSCSMLQVHTQIHDALNESKDSNSLPWYIALDHYTTATMFHCWPNVTITYGIFTLLSTVLTAIRTKKIEFWLIAPNHLWPIFHSMQQWIPTPL
jgi:hypothetical protein